MIEDPCWWCVPPERPTPLLHQSETRYEPIDQNLVISGVKTIPQLIDQSLTLERLLAKLSSFFGVLALLLASIGLYGVMAYAVVRRTKEIGIRMALGAPPGSVRWMVLRETLRLVIVGVLIGVPAALAATRFISSLLYGLTPTDPITVSIAVIILVLSAILAGLSSRPGRHHEWIRWSHLNMSSRAAAPLSTLNEEPFTRHCTKVIQPAKQA